MEENEPGYYTTDDERHELNTLRQCIEYWKRKDDWGVDNIYTHTLYGILMALNIDPDERLW